MNVTDTKARTYAYIRLYVKARAMLLDYGHLEEVAKLDRLYDELMGRDTWLASGGICCSPGIAAPCPACAAEREGVKS